MITRRDLTLYEKVQLIFDNSEDNGLSLRKQEYLNDYETNQNKNEIGEQLDDQV